MLQLESNKVVRSINSNVSKKSESYKNKERNKVREPTSSIKYFKNELTFHHELSIISKTMVELLQYVKPFSGPLFRSITPSACPFGLSPRVPKHYKSLTLAFFGTQNGVSMASMQTINFGGLENYSSLATGIKCVEATAKETIYSRV